MSDDGVSNARWGTAGAIAIILAVVVGLLIYYFTGQVVAAIGVPIVIIGVYEVYSSFRKSKETDQFGTSLSGAALLWGFVFISIGGAVFAYDFTHSIIIAIVVILVVMALYIAVKSFGKKSA